MRIGGLASGIETENLIKQLMQAERIPVDRLYQSREWLSWKQDSYREVNLKTTQFRDNFSNLRLQSSFLAHQVTSSDESSISATGSPTSINGTHQVKINQLAQAARFRSSGMIENADGKVSSTTRVLQPGGVESFTVETKAGKATIQITDDDTYDSMARKIRNATTEDGQSLGLSANFDNTTGRYFLSTNEMGGDEFIAFDEVNGGGFAFIENHILGGSFDPVDEYKGQFGRIEFDGIEINDLTANQTSVNGISIRMHKADPAVVHTLTVASDTDRIFDRISDFVKDYNEMIDDIRGRTQEERNRDFQPLTEEQRAELTEREQELWDEKAQSGTLRNDNNLRSMLTNLRQELMDPVDGIPSGQLNTLQQIGVSTTSNWFDGGKLVIDEGKLRESIATRPDEVRQLFTQTPAEGSRGGVGHRVYQTMNSSISQLTTQAGRVETIGPDQSSLGRQMRQIDEQMDNWQRRLAQTEQRYWRQFTAMESAMAQMNQQSNLLFESLQQMRPQ